VQALDKISLGTNWILLVLVFLFVIIAILKIIDAEKLKGYVFALFNKGFIESEAEEDILFFSSFYNLLFVFSATVLALTVSLLASEINVAFSLTFSSFLSVLKLVFSYLIVKRFLELAFARLLLIKKQVRFFLVCKLSYLYSISFFLLVFYILFLFSPLNYFYFTVIILGLFTLRYLFLLTNNKKLVFSELFYFILYICAFEIAPLLTLFKLMI
jgi:hypothetical protein